MRRRSTTGPEPPRDPGSPGDGRLGRREFCRLTALLGGCALGSLALSRTGLAIGPGRPDFAGEDTIFQGTYPLDRPDAIVLTTCLGCHAACPLRVSREVGVVAKIDGNPWSPRTYGGSPPVDGEDAARLRGAICARGQARLLNTHDPYRLVRPLFRQGGRGQGAWTGLEAAGASGMIQAILAQGMSTILVAADPRQQDRRAALQAFERTFGPAVAHLGVSNPWLGQASRDMLGEPGWELQPRFARADAALIWGADAVASGVDPVGDARALGALRERVGEGAVVVVDPRLSETAGMADTWLPVRPGGDMALAWMMLRAWHDAGVFEGPAAWAEQLAAQPWKDLERRSGLGEEVVRRTAERLAAVGPGLAIRIGGGVGERPDGVAATEAILRLAAVAGAVGSGGAMEPTAAPRPLGQRPDLALQRLLSEGESLDLLIVVGDGGIVDSPRQGELLRALADPGMVRNLVVVAPTMNPVAALADLVVPDVTEHERQGLVQRWDGVSLVQPVVPSVMAEAGLESPWDRGLEGLLELICELDGNPLLCTNALDLAVRATGREQALSSRGWVPPAADAAELPAIDAFREQAVRSPGDAIEGLALVTYREPFGGFVDSTAQYWATPSLRARNEVWLHPATADELGVHEHAELTGDRCTQHVHVRRTEAVRPGVVAVAIGYGHAEGYDGRMTIDGVAVQADPRRTLGFDVGAVCDASGAVTVAPGHPERRNPLASLFAGSTGSCDRL